MSEDTLQTQTIDPLEARVVAFRQQPDARRFTELRQELRDAGRGELLADVCATWAPHERDPLRAADAWSEAGEAMVVLGEPATAVEYLRTALELDPTNDRATDRLLDIVEPDDPALAVEIIEHELAELARLHDPSRKRAGNDSRRKADVVQRRAAQHRRAAELWHAQLGRVDRALWHFQQAWKLEPHRSEALEAARQLYASLGDDAMVAKLFQAELDVLASDRSPAAAARKATVRLELGKLAMRANDLDAAAGHLEEASQLDPGLLEVAETLAEIYAMPGFRSDAEDGAWRHKASELFVEVGRRRIASRDDTTGINYLRRAIGIDPHSRGNSVALEQALSEAAQWHELDRMLRHRASVVHDPGERAELLRRRAALYRNQLPDRDGLIEVLSELVGHEPPAGRAARELRELLRDGQDWEALSRLMESEINALGQDPQTPASVLVDELLELATVAREHMGDRDRAAELLHQALGVDPTHEEALARYVDHFRERRDWRGLIELMEFALDNMREAGADPRDLVRRLEEIAQLAELRLGDIPRAIDAWQRIAELEPGSPKVAEALRRLSARAKMWEQLVASLEDEIATAPSESQRTIVLKKMAQTYRERQIEPRRAIELYEQIVQANPDDDHTLKALCELYEREGDDAGLAHSLRRIVELDERRLVSADGSGSGSAGSAGGPRGLRLGSPGAPGLPGKPGDAKDWPVAKRAERLTMLRRLAILYETRLADVDGVVFASRAILELLHGDRDALERMERVLDRAGDPRLEQVLEYHVAASASPAERTKLLKRLARIAAARRDDVLALDRWEQTLRASPADRDALTALAAIYEATERWPELAQILERLDGGRPLPAPGSPESAARAAELERYASVLDRRLGDGARAIRAWHRLLELIPRHRAALEALVRLYRAASKWRELADVLGMQIEVFAGHTVSDDGARATAAALDRAEIFEGKLGAPGEAIKVLDHLIRELNPNHLGAHTQLRRLYEARGEFDAAVRVAEREMYLAPEPQRKIARGLEIGLICRDRLGNPTRALQAFKRVLELDPAQDEALAATADLLGRLGKWKDHVAMLERMLARVPAAGDTRDPVLARAHAEARRQIVQRIAAATADKLGDPRAAFRWWHRAHDEAPDEHTLADVRQAGEAYALWHELAEVLTDERKRLIAIGNFGAIAPEIPGMPAEPERFAALSRELADLAERKLGDKPRAVAVLAEALAVKPRELTLLAELDRLTAEIDHRPSWKLLLEGYDVALATAAPPERVALYLRRARVLEDRLHDPKAAIADALAAFSWAPDRDDIRDVVVGLASKARAWSDVIAIDNALIERASTSARRVELLRRKAAVIEDQLKDAPRAFRAHLVALLLEPDDAETTSHLWRLARIIGKYRDADRTPHPDPPPAAIQADAAIAEAVAAAMAATPLAANPAGPAATSNPGRQQAATNPGASNPGRQQQPTTSNPGTSNPATSNPGGQQPAAVPTKNLRRIATEPLADADLSPATLSVGDSTQPLDVDEIELAEPRRGGNPGSAGVPGGPSNPGNPFTRESGTMTLSPRDLRDMMVPPRLPPGAKAPPKPPPRPPQIRAGIPLTTGSARITTPPPPTPRKAQANVRRAPLPGLISRSFESPWEELAMAYEAMPAPDADSRLRWLYRASEVWEVGAKDIVRAFDALARAFAQARRSQEGDADVRARLSRIAQEHNAWDRLAALYEGMAEEAETAVEAADLLMEVATIRTEQNKSRDAEVQLRRVLGMLPGESVARSRLEALYRAQGRYVELAASLEERTDPRLGTVAPESERAQLLRELAAIYTDKLTRPHDAIDAFERLRLLVPGDTSVLVHLAGLYGSVGRWSKVIETLSRVNEIAEGTTKARDALRAIARIYEHELELPERAIESYGQLVATWPDDVEAWAALDRLYAGNARWTELADVLRRRAALEREPSERAALLARRAQVLLDWLGAPEEAAAALRHARTIAPDDVTLADLLFNALLKASRDREAAAILEGRIAMHGAAGDASRGDLAALLIRLAQLRLERLEDHDGARAAIDQALQLVPEHPAALSVLAQLASPDADPRAFADAKLREADSARDEDNRIAALMAAGDVLQARVGDTAAARAAYQHVLALRPYHADATWALAGLVEKGGDPESAARVLEKRLDDGSLTPPEKARILTQLAALSRAAGVEPAAERRLLEALGCVPDHIPAIIALADFYADAARWSDLEAFLREILDGSTLGTAPAAHAAHAAPAALVADLHRRLATAQERLGRDEEAYQTLVAADRLHRGHLLIKLALGENRFKARRWREAALHLSPLASHDDAVRYPSEVAHGLFHAGLAEIRSLRPEKAPALYARALELKPQHTLALQALAEIAMEQGDHRRAADLLTRQATATDDPSDRMRLFEALGDMALAMLHDDDRAQTCYAAAVAAAQPLEAKHVPLLEKLLERQTTSGDLAGAARTAELAAAFGATPGDRATRHLRAAHNYLAAGDVTRARAAVDRAIESDPYDVDAVDLASRLAIEHGDVDVAAAILTRLLTAKDDRLPPAQTARRAALSYRLGNARAQRGDLRQAASAYERAVGIAPDSEGAIQARRGLVDLLRAANDSTKREAIAVHLQAITHATGALDDLVAWADELRRQNLVDPGRATLELAIACGHIPDVHQRAFLSIHMPHVMHDDEPFKATLDGDRALIADPDQVGFAPVAVALSEAAVLVWPDLDETLARNAVAGARRIPAALHTPATAMFPRIATALGAGAVVLYERETGADVTVVAAATPVIVLGPRMLATTTPTSEIRAILTRAVELTRPEHLAFMGLPLSDVTRLLTSIVRLFGPGALRDTVAGLVNDPDVQRGHDDMVRAALPIKLRTRFEQLLASMPPESIDVRGYLAACQRSADRAALLLGGDPKPLAELASGRAESHRHLIAAIAQPHWLSLRARLGMGVR